MSYNIIPTNGRQKLILAAGMVAILIMGLFPPYMVSTGPSKFGLKLPAESHVQFGFILSPPSGSYSTVEIHAPQFAVQVIVVLLLTWGGTLLTRTAGSKGRQAGAEV